MWRRSIGPASDGTGTTGTPARNPATTAITVSSVAFPLTATAREPPISAATASAEVTNPAHEVASP